MGQDKKINLYDLVPLDNIDLTGVAYNPTLPPPPGVPAPAPQRYRYARANQVTSDSTSAAWHCVYPGPYDPSQKFHHTGLLQVLAQDIPGAMADNGYLGEPKAKFNGLPTPASGAAYSPYATYDTRPLQINNRDSAGPNRPYIPSTAGPPTPQGEVQPAFVGNWPMSLPLGGFARSGDLLQVPFIGSYRILTSRETRAPKNMTTQDVNTLEMNSVTMDSVYAQFKPPNTISYLPNPSAKPAPSPIAYDSDTSLGTPFHNEQIGHFCPMNVGSTDFQDDPGEPTAAFTNNVKNWTYHWAKRLFDYVDVRTPQDAYLPNVDPAAGPNASGDPSLPGSAPKYSAPPPAPISDNPNIAPVSSSGYQQLQGRLDTASTEGLININTANWKVLSAVPWFTPGEDPNNYMADNAAIAQAIVTWRDTNNAAYPNAPSTDFGPFRSIFDLMKVPGFTTLFNKYWVSLPAGTPGEVTNRYGDLSPFAPTLTPVAGIPEADPTDHVYGDVKTRFLGLSRISNLITTRSDSFTVYVQVQGWQNVGTSLPILIATRRAAAFLDRSQVVPTRNAYTPTVVDTTPMGVINVPND